MTSAAADAPVAKAASVVLLTLAAGQFLMTLDTSVMNVSIATVADDVGTAAAPSRPRSRPTCRCSSSAGRSSRAWERR
jgi:hypothetical protein